MGKSSYGCAFSILFLLFTMSVQGQDRFYFLTFKGKDKSLEPNQFLSKRALDRRAKQHIQLVENDYPVDTRYLKALLDSSVSLVFTSKWLNGCMISTRSPVISNLRKLPFVSSIIELSPPQKSTSQKTALSQVSQNVALDYGNAAKQIENLGADKMHAAGFNGQGRYIAVFDGGFSNANNISSLQPLFQENRLKFTYNVVAGNPSVYGSHSHGTNVLTCLAAYAPGNLIGMAFGADYALIVTEDVTSERLAEEYFWLRGAELADSIGVDIISSSLGYNTFDNMEENHSLDQLNGKTAIITLAAELAASKGILVVTSAGNNYDNAIWRKIVFPADGDSVLAVGALDGNGNKASFSAIGPSADGRVKPDLSALGTGVIAQNESDTFTSVSGTSYSAPLVAGLAAGLWQMDTTLSNMELMTYLVQSATQYCTPNSQIGHGVPQFEVARELVTQQKMIDCRPNGIDYTLPNHLGENIVFQEGIIAFEGKQYAILDVDGKVLFQGHLGTTHFIKIKIDIRHLKPGVYFLRVDERVFRLLKT